MNLLQRLFGSNTVRVEQRNELEGRIGALFNHLAGLYGEEKLVLKAGKFEALDYMRSDDNKRRIIALKRILEEDPVIDLSWLKGREIERVLDELEDSISELIAYRSVEDRIENRVAEKMQERQNEYLNEMKRELLQEKEGVDNARTLKKYAELEKMEHTNLSQSTLEMLKPKSLNQIVGQEKAIRALLSKIASPYPQHVIIYGPPGVGKTTAARLALEEAKDLKCTPFQEDASFVEVDGTTLRWDPREVTNPLLGSVHDPIYQGAQRGLAQEGIPEPKTGLVTEAHGGLLFIDEIGELDPILQGKLLKVLEDKRVLFDSSYYDPEAENIPQYIRKLFEEGAPADFILIGATTRRPSEINPALRSRSAEIFFNPLTPMQIKEIVNSAAARLEIELTEASLNLISRYTTEGRKAINILSDTYGLYLYQQESEGEEGSVVLEEHLVKEVLQLSRLKPSQHVRVSEKEEVGRVFGLGVSGYLGSVIEIETIAFPAYREGKGELRFNETAGTMTRDSIFNATSVFRKLTGKDIRDFDLHVNIVGGANIDGPSAGAAILLSIISAVRGDPLPQNIAISGEISIQGRLKPVGGIAEKIYGAYQAGLERVYIPYDNRKEIPDGCEVETICVNNIEELLARLHQQEKEIV